MMRRSTLVRLATGSVATAILAIVSLPFLAQAIARRNPVIVRHHVVRYVPESHDGGDFWP